MPPAFFPGALGKRGIKRLKNEFADRGNIAPQRQHAVARGHDDVGAYIIADLDEHFARKASPALHQTGETV